MEFEFSAKIIPYPHMKLKEYDAYERSHDGAWPTDSSFNGGPIIVCPSGVKIGTVWRLL